MEKFICDEVVNELSVLMDEDKMIKRAMFIRGFIIFLFSLTLVIQSASAQPQILGKWDYGAAFDVVASNNHLFVGAGEQ
uniref:hypothetical protein n=1 Tax=Archaeoglobus sp. JdFR-39 TaxID=1934996 RepID=UPI0025C02A5D